MSALKELEQVQAAEDKKIVEIEKQPGKHPPPPEIQLSNEDRLKLIASEAMMGKVVSDLNLMRLQIGSLGQQLKESERTLGTLSARHQDLLNELAAKYAVPNMNLYAVDYDTGKGVLRSAQQAPANVSRR